MANRTITIATIHNTTQVRIVVDALSIPNAPSTMTRALPFSVLRR